MLHIACCCSLEFQLLLINLLPKQEYHLQVENHASASFRILLEGHILSSSSQCSAMQTDPV
jgi:hypothetical protein